MARKSMTGFGRGEATADGKVWLAEIRCVNNRFLDLKIKLPRRYAQLEERIKQKISSCHQRGRVDLLLSVSGDFSDQQKVSVNLGLAREYHDALSQLTDELSLDGSGKLALLAHYPDIIVREQAEEDIEQVWPLLDTALTVAIEQCEVMRQTEGVALQQDIAERIVSFEKTVDSVEAALPQILVTRRQKLEERLEKLLGGVQLDPQRLAQEVAILADKSDVTEELVRLRSHIQQFQSSLAEDGAVGRKLDFLIQEFLREVNTLASKINDANIAHLTVELKGELEKIREQVQNIE